MQCLGSRSGSWPKSRAVASLKTAVVTGGASGIGRAIAERLRADGFRVAVIDLSASDDEFSHVVDVTDREQVDAAVAAIREQLGPILVLVNSAGMTGFQKFSKISFAEWSKVIDVNLNGVFHTIQAVLPDMVEAGWGRIVNISSSSTHSGQPLMAHYVAAKSAVNGLTKSLALEYGPAGITVNAVPPGFVDTPMLRGAESQAPARRNRRRPHQPHAGAPGGPTRGHRRRLRVFHLGGSQLHHRTDTRRQRRSQHLRGPDVPQGPTLHRREMGCGAG